MALRTGFKQSGIQEPGFVVNPALRVVHHRLRFLGRQPMPPAEILDDGPSLWWRQGDVVLADHAFECLLPAFGRGARPGNALQISLLVGGVAPSTFGHHQGVGDGDAYVDLALREQRHRRNQQDYRGLYQARRSDGSTAQMHARLYASESRLYQACCKKSSDRMR